jgi:hypothetical protein
VCEREKEREREGTWVPIFKSQIQGRFIPNVRSSRTSERKRRREKQRRREGEKERRREGNEKKGMRNGIHLKLNCYLALTPSLTHSLPLFKYF